MVYSKIDTSFNWVFRKECNHSLLSCLQVPIIGGDLTNRFTQNDQQAVVELCQHVLSYAVEPCLKFEQGRSQR